MILSARSVEPLQMPARQISADVIPVPCTEQYGGSLKMPGDG